MNVSPELAQLFTSLGELAIRNTASAIAVRIQAIRSGKGDREAITELLDIVNELLDERAQLISIARALQEALVAQRIADDDIRYITETLLPTVERLASAGGESLPADVLDGMKALLSTETLKVMQLVGFNFKAAIGEPLTLLVERLILSRVPDAKVTHDIAAINAQREVEYLKAANDPEAWARLQGNE